MAKVGGDFTGALKRLGGDAELLQELADYFAEDAPKLLAEIRTGLTAGDAEMTRRAAHSLRGLAANFDAEEAIASSRSIEDMAGKGELQLATAAVSQLEAEIHTLLSALERYFARSSAPSPGNSLPFGGFQGRSFSASRGPE